MSYENVFKSGQKIDVAFQNPGKLERVIQKFGIKRN